MVDNFCRVQIFMDFVRSSYPQKIVKFTYIVFKYHIMGRSTFKFLKEHCSPIKIKLLN